MNKLVMLLASVAVATLASGCIMVASDGKGSGDTPKQCNADALQSFVGLKITSDITEKIRSQSSSGSVRVIRPNQPVTMDYSATRVNVHLDKDDRITMITCG